MEYKKIKDIVVHPKYVELENYFTFLKEKAVTAMSYSDDEVTIYRCQGQIAILDLLLKLRANAINDGKK